MNRTLFISNKKNLRSKTENILNRICDFIAIYFDIRRSYRKVLWYNYD